MTIRKALLASVLFENQCFSGPDDPKWRWVDIVEELLSLPVPKRGKTEGGQVYRLFAGRFWSRQEVEDGETVSGEVEWR